MNAGKNSRGRGFTVVELILVISIVACLLAILAPAVNVARESARRSECASNLKALAIALHNYHDTYRAFPAGTEFSGSSPIAPLWSWEVKILPYLEYVNLYDQLDHPSGITSPTNRQVLAERIAPFHCPSDWPPREHVQTGGMFAGSWALTSYLGASGADGVQASGDGRILSPAQCKNLDSTYEFGTRSGVFFGDSYIRFDDILDGSSNTILIGERGVPEDGRHGWLTGPGLADACPAGWTDVVLPADDNFGLGGLRARRGQFDERYHWWSHHPGVANFAFCDGRVVCLTYEIDKYTFRALTTRNGRDFALFIHAKR